MSVRYNPLTDSALSLMEEDAATHNIVIHTLMIRYENNYSFI